MGKITTGRNLRQTTLRGSKSPDDRAGSSKAKIRTPPSKIPQPSIGTSPGTSGLQTLPTPSSPSPTKSASSSKADDSDSDASSTSSKKTRQDRSQERADEQEKIMGDEEVVKCREELLALTNYQAPGVSSEEIRVIAKSKNFVFAILSATTRLPASIRKEVFEALTVLESAAIELESKYQYKSAEASILQNDKSMRAGLDTGSTTHTNTQNTKITTQAQTPSKARVNLNFAKAVKAATSSLVINAPESAENSVEDIEQKIRDSGICCEGVVQVKKIGKGLKIQCTNAERATELKEKLANNSNVGPNITVDSARVPRRKIMIFHVPEATTTETISKAIIDNLGLHQTPEFDWFAEGKTIHTRENTKHIPVTLPEPLALELVTRKRIYIGLKSCPIKKYIHITRCNNCQCYDHTELNCRNGVPICAKCTNKHKTEDCDNRTPRCINCHTYNANQKAQYRNRARIIHEDHYTFSPQCHIYKTLLRARQIQVDQRLGTPLVRGLQLISGEVTITTRGGREVILQRQSQHNNQLNNYRENTRR